MLNWHAHELTMMPHISISDPESKCNNYKSKFKIKEKAKFNLWPLNLKIGKDALLSNSVIREKTITLFKSAYQTCYPNRKVIAIDFISW